MNRQFRGWLVIGLLLVPAAAIAEPATSAADTAGAADAAGASGASGASGELTLDRALVMARAQNRDLRAARARLDLAAASTEQARAALFPTAGAQAKYTHNNKEVEFDLSALGAGTNALADAIRTTTTNPAEAAAIQAFQQASASAAADAEPVVIQKGEQLDFAVSATVPLVVPSAYFALSAAHASQRASAASYQVSEATILTGVARAYFAAAGTEELVNARSHAVKLAQDTLDNARARVAAQTANKVDELRAQTALVRAQQQATEAEDARRSAYRALATLLATREPLHVQTATAEVAAPAAVDALVTGARRDRPELTAQRRAVDAAAAASRAGAWRWSPTLSAFGNLHGANYTGFSGDRYGWAVGLELDWVLFDGGVRDAQRHQSEAQRREADARLAQLGDTVADEVADARDELATAQRAVASAQQTVTLATETLRLVRAQYDAGAVRQLDVLEAQDGLVNAEVGLAQSHFSLSLADIELRRASGTFPDRTRASAGSK